MGLQRVGHDLQPSTHTHTHRMLTNHTILGCGSFPHRIQLHFLKNYYLQGQVTAVDPWKEHSQVYWSRFMFEYNLILFLVWAERLQMTRDGISVIFSLVSAWQMVHLSLSLQLWSLQGLLLFAVFLLFSLMSFALSTSSFTNCNTAARSVAHLFPWLIVFYFMVS